MSQWLSWNFGPEASLPRGGRHPAHPFWESQTGSFVLPLDRAVACQPPYQIGLFFKPVTFCGWSRGWCPCHPEPPARSSMEGVNSGPSCSCPAGAPARASLCCRSPLASLPWSGSTQSSPPSACPSPLPAPPPKSFLCPPPPGGSTVKNPSANAGDARDEGSIPGEGNGNPLQYSCWENSMDEGARQAI